MKTIEDSVMRTFTELPTRLLSDLVAEKLKAHGVTLSPRALKSLERHLATKEGAFVVQRWKWWDRRTIDLKFTDEDLQKIERKVAKVEALLPEIVEKLTVAMSEKMLEDMKQRWPEESRTNRVTMTRFEQRLYERWEEPLELLRLLMTICVELGADLNEEITNSRKWRSRRRLFDVLRRSHARGCQIAHEIVALLEGGFADGAMARWRTLHEVAVVAAFIAEHGEEVAERYVLHQVVESKRAAAEYQRCQARLGYEPLDPGELATIQADYDKLIARFGKDFGAGYGWAADTLKNSRPSFAQIEQAVGSDHFRAHYRMASHNVHANPKGVFFQLGLMRDTPRLMAGPSNSGLADPGHGAAISLLNITATFVSLDTTLDNAVVLRVGSQLVTEIGDAFGKAHVRLQEDEAALRAARR
jgi:hypothetical protein